MPLPQPPPYTDAPPAYSEVGGTLLRKLYFLLGPLPMKKKTLNKFRAAIFFLNFFLFLPGGLVCCLCHWAAVCPQILLRDLNHPLEVTNVQSFPLS